MVQPICMLLKQETVVSGSGISWAICKSAPRSRQPHQPAASIQIYFWGAIDAPKAPRGWGPLRERSGEGAGPPPQKFVFNFGSHNGDLWCILSAIFCSSAKTLRGRKDTLAQVYFYWGGGGQSPPPPAAIDATDTSTPTLCFLQAG